MKPAETDPETTQQDDRASALSLVRAPQVAPLDEREPGIVVVGVFQRAGRAAITPHAPPHSEDEPFEFDPNPAGAEPLEFVLNPTELDAETNGRLRTHAARVPWVHAAAVGTLHAWFPTINERFLGGVLGVPAIAIEPLRKGTLGTYRVGRDGFGLTCHITISEELAESVEWGKDERTARDGEPVRAKGEADSSAGSAATTKEATDRPGIARLIAVLGHEMIHAWEETVKTGGTRAKRGKPWYHSNKFRERADDMGIPTTEKGEYKGVTRDGAMAALFVERGIPFDREIDPKPEVARPSKSRLVKWTCGCKGNTVYASYKQVISARCCNDGCGRPFERAEAAQTGGVRG